MDRSDTLSGARAMSERQSFGRAPSARAGWTLIELLVVIVIASIVGGMLVTIWLSLGQSYAHTSRSAQAGDFARDAVARLARELRDAEGTGSSAAVIKATPHEVIFYTTFNDASNQMVLSEPVATRYWCSYDPETDSWSLHRQEDTDEDLIWTGEGHDGTDPGDLDVVLVRRIVNPLIDGQPDIFGYAFFEGNEAVMDGIPDPDSSGLAAMLSTMFMVHVQLMVDVNGQGAPKAMNLNTTVQLRNQTRY